ncbi:hypothetical protein Tco_1308911 [Tanacetum coccineum]
MSPGIVTREGIPFELFRSTYPGRHVARETYPQRQVARDTPDLSLGNMANVVVCGMPHPIDGVFWCKKEPKPSFRLLATWSARRHDTILEVLVHYYKKCFQDVL